MNVANLIKLTVDDLLVLSSKDLITLKTTLEDTIERRKERDKNEFLDKVAVLATESGFALDDVFLKQSKTISRVKYRNPKDLTQGWTGRGRKPNWLIALLDSGKKLDDFKI